MDFLFTLLDKVLNLRQGELSPVDGPFLDCWIIDFLFDQFFNICLSLINLVLIF